MTQQMKQEYGRWRGYFVLFFAIHIFNAFFILSPAINNNMNPFRLGFLATANAFLGNFAILAFFLAFVLLLSNKKKTIRNWLTVSTVFFSLIMLGLKVYVFYYGSYFSFYIVDNFKNPAGEMAIQLTITSLKMMFHEGQFVTLLPIVVVLLFNRFVLRKDIALRPMFYDSLAPTRKQGVLLFILGFLMVSISAINAQLMKNDSYFEHHRVPLFGVQTMGAYHYYVNDFMSYATHGEFVLTDDQKTAVEDYVQTEIDNPCYEDDCAYTDAMANHYGLFAGKNLVMFQLESLNRFIIGLEVNGTMVMPFLTSLANQSDVLDYPNFFSSIGIGKTTDAEFASLTGIYPTGFTVSYFEHITSGIESIPSLFQAVGYRTLAVHGSPVAFYNRVGVHPLLGFDDSFGSEQIDPERLHQVNGWTDDATVFAYALSQMKRQQTAAELFFMQLLSTVSHLPYFAHPDYTRINDWGIRDTTMISQALDYYKKFDRDLEQLFQNLASEGLLDNTVFMLYGDHSSGILKGDLERILPNLEKQEFQRMLQNVPLLIYTPGVVLSGVDTSLVRSQIDMKRTAATLFDLPIQRYYGVDILSNVATVAYNPQNFDIVTDRYFLSATSRYIMSNEVISPAEIDAAMTAFYWRKQYNDWILKSNYFEWED
jgi:lipoteichoic acid synthase